MKQRCQYPKSKDYPAYGGAGVTVCAQWQTFAGFLADMGERPDGTTLDRYPDRNGNYEPGNCRWADAIEQTRNRSATFAVEFEGETLPLRIVCQRTGAPYALLYRRIRKGFTLQQALDAWRNGEFRTYGPRKL